MPDAIIPDGSLAPNVQPTGFSAAIIAISVIFCALSILVVALRTVTRLQQRFFGIDDGLMVAGTAIYIAATGISSYACFRGVGIPAPEASLLNTLESIKYEIIWVEVYICASTLIKSSICFTMLRIAAVMKPLRSAVYGLLALILSSWLVVFVGVLSYCKPVQAAWLPLMVASGEGTCHEVSFFNAMGWVFTASSLAVDLSLTLLPIFMLRNSQMMAQSKVQVFALLSFGSAASLFTIARIPFVVLFESQENIPFWIGFVTMFSNVETGFGCIAASLPALRRFMSTRTAKTNASGGYDSGRASGPNSHHLVTFGGSGGPGSKGPTGGGKGMRFSGGTDTKNNATIHSHGDGSWERLTDLSAGTGKDHP